MSMPTWQEAVAGLAAARSAAEAQATLLEGMRADRSALDRRIVMEESRMAPLRTRLTEAERLVVEMALQGTFALPGGGSDA